MSAFTWAQMGVLALFMLASFLTGWLWRDETAYDEHEQAAAQHRREISRINRYRNETSNA